MPITPRQYENRPYVRPAYEPDTRTLLDLMRAAGQARSSAIGRRGQAKAEGLLTLGQVISGALRSQRVGREQQQMAEMEMAEKQAARQQDEAFRRDQLAAMTEDREANRAFREQAAAQAEWDRAEKAAIRFGAETAPGPISEQGLDVAAADPATFARTRYSFGPGTAEGPELRPTPQQEEMQRFRETVGQHGGTVSPTGSVFVPPKVDKPGYMDTLEWAAANGDKMAQRALQIKQAQQQPPATRFDPRPVVVDGQTVIANYDARTGEYFHPDTRQKLTGVGQPPTADMRNKEAGKRTAARAVEAVRTLGEGIITKVGPAQRMEAIKRGAEAVFGNDPEFQTYQDSRMALAGTLAVEQQGARVSDADVKALWLPMVPDAYRDTSESYKLKWDLINAMRGVESKGGAGTVRMIAPNGQEQDVPADQVEHYKNLGAKVKT